jgi:tRNA dimethylallyltransferase
VVARIVPPGDRHQSCATLPGRGTVVLSIAAIVGPTAVGKSVIAERLAERYGATIVSVDSMQVYRGMDVGTAKPGIAVQSRIDYRMIDVCDPAEELTVQRFQQLARASASEIIDDGGKVIIAGGSGLHFRAIVDPLTFAPTDLELRRRLDAYTAAELRAELVRADAHAQDVVDLENPRRVHRAVEVLRLTGQTPSERASTREAAALRSYEALMTFCGFGIDAGDAIEARITRRLTAMVDDGLVEEVTHLQARLGRTASQAIGYKQYGAMVQGRTSSREAFVATVRATKALVKRQRTFFRRDPRISWISWQDDDELRVENAVNTIAEAMQWNS